MFEWHISGTDLFHSNKDFTFSHNIEFCKSKLSDNLSFYIDGYILPRNQVFASYAHLNQAELLDMLYYEYSLEFIKYIKGVFIIIILKDERLYIFNDRHSIKKFFVYKDENAFIISSSLLYISDCVKLVPNKENAALYCLFEHFVQGTTLFNNVEYSQPATLLSFDGSLNIHQYWSPQELLKSETTDHSFEYYSGFWKELIKQYLDYLKPGDISITLTGGNDSRMILAALLNLGVKPNAFTFGNPDSTDGIVARKIAKAVGLNYNNYFVEYPTKDWFSQYSQKLIQQGNTLINIHRSHRLYAIEKEQINNPKVEMIFGGFMGGDYLKGINYDDYITAKLIRFLETIDERLDRHVPELLDENFMKMNSLDLNILYEKINNLDFIKEPDKRKREFLYIFNVIGSLHDTQDTNIFCNKIKYTVNPFMDEDFLALIFTSKHSMMFKNNIRSNIFNRISQSSFHINLTHLLAPQLSDIEYAKRGHYTANEYFGNKIVLALKRIIRYKIPIRNSPPSFTYKSWMKDFVKESIRRFSNSTKELSFLNDGLVKKDIESVSFSEGSLHKYTNMVNIDLNYKRYIEKR